MFANPIMNNAMNGFMPNMQMPMAPQMWPQFGIMPQISITPQPFASSMLNPPSFIQPYLWPHPEPPPPTRPPKPIQIPVTVIFGPENKMSVEEIMTIPNALRNKIERDEEIVDADLNSINTKSTTVQKEDSKESAMDKVPYEVETVGYKYQDTTLKRVADTKKEIVQENIRPGYNFSYFSIPPVPMISDSDSHSNEFHEIRIKYHVPIPVPIPYPYPVPDPPPGVPFPFPADPNDGHQLPRPMHGSLAMQYPLPHFSEPPTYMQAKYTLPWHQPYSFPVTNPETDTESSSEDEECSAS